MSSNAARSRDFSFPSATVCTINLFENRMQLRAKRISSAIATTLQSNHTFVNSWRDDDKTEEDGHRARVARPRKRQAATDLSSGLIENQNDRRSGTRYG